MTLLHDLFSVCYNVHILVQPVALRLPLYIQRRERSYVHFLESPVFTVVFDSNTIWYYGLDGKPDRYGSGWYKQDFVTVALHELLHGFGFASKALLYDNRPTKGRFVGNAPYNIYDTYLVDENFSSLVDYDINQQHNLLGEALRTGPYFNGSFSNRYNLGPIPMNKSIPNFNPFGAPSHFDFSFYHAKKDGLMASSIRAGDSYHNIGQAARGILRDLGYNVHGITEMSFSADNTVMPVDDEVNFACETYGDIEKYYWDFGDGNTSTEVDPTHYYSNTGLYSVSLTLNDTLTLTKEELIKVVPDESDAFEDVEVYAHNGKLYIVGDVKIIPVQFHRSRV